MGTDFLFDLLFPRKCLGCGRTGGYFCSSCLNFVKLCENDICPMCNRFSVGGFVHKSCAKALGLDGLTSIFKYEGIIKKAIKKLKYRFVTDLANDLVELFLSFCGENKAFVGYCRSGGVVLVPIPLHPARKRWRGFNQSELLGKLIAENLDLEFIPDLLVRVKKTQPQADLDKKDRQKNIRQAFVINENLQLNNWKICNYILFDDIWTSGATLLEATKVLKRAGAKKAWGLTLAR